MVTAELTFSEEIEPKVQGLLQRFKNAAPEQILKWTIEEFGSEIALATGFGAEGCVLIDMISKLDRSARIFYLDTDFFFPETYALLERLELRYSISFERRATSLSPEAQASQYGDRLWERHPDECCRLRKVEPLIEALAGLRAWITGIRRDQSPARATAAVVERDRKFHLIKINPLVGWSSIEVWKYIVKHDVPYNPLHDKGFPSIGCTHCTTPVRAGEDPRAGRWRERPKTECGLHK